MVSRIRKVLNNKKGFTLIELMTVLVILGVIMGIGIPRYVAVQDQAEYDADVATINSIAKAAETYVAIKNVYADSDVGVKISELVTAKFIDGDIALNRADGGGRNKDGSEKIGTTHKDQVFTIDAETGKCNDLAAVIIAMIGNPPMGS
ncbi:MAG: prepilin-type N-terminal cleavage/methylation domain-containing protein [Clostridia bacterium]|nr:prepilin-type N-terminal cleavage/methylation domain-containing protein [Clostridia bacterium]MDD4049107.1 prepilin-type N-terminal cleavage/methylation domain-containing protein [Clostridia bacterium]